MEVLHIAETESRRCWVITIEIQKHTQSYAITLRHGFGGSESPYSIKLPGSEQFKLKDAPIYQAFSKIEPSERRDDALVDTDEWRLLACISPHNMSDVTDSNVTASLVTFLNVPGSWTIAGRRARQNQRVPGQASIKLHCGAHAHG